MLHHSTTKMVFKISQNIIMSTANMNIIYKDVDFSILKTNFLSTDIL